MKTLVHNTAHGARHLVLASLAEREDLNEIRDNLYAKATEENQAEQSDSTTVPVEFPEPSTSFGVKIALAL